jgi:hypothetical protein
VVFSAIIGQSFQARPPRSSAIEQDMATYVAETAKSHFSPWDPVGEVCG